MKIKEMLEDSRPRERLVKFGVENLSNSEILALILEKGTKQENVIEMSDRLISKYGLDKLSQCSLKELQEIKGIGFAKACQILALFEFNKRHSQAKNPITKISDAEDVFNYFKDRLKDEKQECFYILMLNNMNYVIEDKLISKGTLDKTLIHPRELFRQAIKNAVSKIVLVHNHPDGDPTPSINDLEITEELVKSGNLIGIKIIDHVIIGKGEKWSWKEGH